MGCFLWPRDWVVACRILGCLTLRVWGRREESRESGVKVSHQAFKENTFPISIGHQAVIFVGRAGFRDAVC